MTPFRAVLRRVMVWLPVLVLALEKRGATARAAELRSQRSLRRGDMQQDIAQARTAAASKTEPRPRLQLLQLLAARHGPFLADRARRGPHDLVAAAEMTALVAPLRNASW